MKLCSKCGVVKHRRDFIADRRLKSGLAARCKECARLYRIAWPTLPTRRQCRIDGCTGLAHARDLCAMHYQRWQHAGELGLPSARDRAELLHLPETDKAYIAAFLDGEGTIGMRRTRRPGGQPPVGTSARARRLPLHQGRQPRRPLLPARAPRAVRPAGGPVSGPTRQLGTHAARAHGQRRVQHRHAGALEARARHRARTAGQRGRAAGDARQPRRAHAR